jgi:tRNA pseudouridine55 synthase
MKKEEFLDRVIPVRKSKGHTTYECVRRVRKLTGDIKVGHAGTLDPIAEGLVLILTGDATKLSDYLMDLPKTYVAEIKLGESTDTKDSTGTVMEKADWRLVTEEMIRQILPEFIGEREQVPPMFSAVKHRGTPLYILARRGEKVGRNPRRVQVYDIELLSCSLPFIQLKVKCSRGFYIRVLAENIGRSIGVPSHMWSLVREEIGHFNLEGALPDNSLESFFKGVELGYSMVEATEFMPTCYMTTEETSRLNNGIPPNTGNNAFGEGDLVRLIRYDGSLGGIGIVDGEGCLRLKRVFAKKWF